MTSRREKIEAMLVDDPDDVFLRYSLALELAKEGHRQRGIELLLELTEPSIAYVPAYFMAGQQLAQAAQFDDARSILRSGIERARQQGDLHAAGEMSDFLASLGRV